MLTVASTTRRAGTGRIGSARGSRRSIEGRGRRGDRGGGMARALGERLGARRAHGAELTHHGAAHLAGTPLERGLATAGRPAGRPAPRNRQSGRERAVPRTAAPAGRRGGRCPSTLGSTRPGPMGSSHACASRARSAGGNLVRLGAADRSRGDPPDVAVERGDGTRRSRSTPRRRPCTDPRRAVGPTRPRPAAPARRGRGRSLARPRAGPRRAGCSRGPPKPGGHRRARPRRARRRRGTARRTRSKMGSTRAACVCCSITSETSVR